MPEHQNRLSALEEKVKNAGLDAFLISTKDSIFYFTGFRYEPFERSLLLSQGFQTSRV